MEVFVGQWPTRLKLMMTVQFKCYIRQLISLICVMGSLNMWAHSQSVKVVLVERDPVVLYT